MAKRKRPDVEEEEQETETTGEETPTTSEAEHKRVTEAGEAGLIRSLPPDLGEYDEGEFTQLETKEVFSLKMVKDDPAGNVYHLKNKLHYYELNEKDFRRLFEKGGKYQEEDKSED
jgi:hypothetical protein